LVIGTCIYIYNYIIYIGGSYLYIYTQKYWLIIGTVD